MLPCIHNKCHGFELASCEDKLSRRWYNKPNIGLLHICWRSGGCDNIYLQEIILTWWTIAAHGAWDSRTKYYRVVWTLHTPPLLLLPWQYSHIGLTHLHTLFLMILVIMQLVAETCIFKFLKFLKLLCCVDPALTFNLPNALVFSWATYQISIVSVRLQIVADYFYPGSGHVSWRD